MFEILIVIVCLLLMACVFIALRYTEGFPCGVIGINQKGGVLHVVLRSPSYAARGTVS